MRPCQPIIPREPELIIQVILALLAYVQSNAKHLAQHSIADFNILVASTASRFSVKSATIGRLVVPLVEQKLFFAVYFLKIVTLSRKAFIMFVKPLL